MTEKINEEEISYESESDSEDMDVESSRYFPPTISDNDEESGRRTSSSLNNYSVLPPIKSATDDQSPQPQQFIKQLQEKYQQNGTSDISNDAKLDDAFLKMKRLDKALEEAFEKEKQVKYETMSLIKKLRSEMQSMTVALNTDPNEMSHTQTNLKRFLALDDEILKLDGCVIDDDDDGNPTESIFKTQINDPLADSNSTHKSEKESSTSDAKSLPNKKKKSSLSSNSTTNTKDSSKKSKVPAEKDFIKRNIQLAKELGGTYALTDDEKQRLNELLKEDEQENAVALPNQSMNGYVPSNSDNQRIKEIDELLEKEYYNPLLNHQLRRNMEHDIDYGNFQQITNEENDLLENPFGERTLKETRLQREHMQRLRKIDEKLERLHQPVSEIKIEAILSDEQLNELLGQCAVDEMKQRYSFLNRDKQDLQGIDFNDLSNYTLTHYVDNNQGPMITDEIIQLLISEAQQEGITLRQYHEEEDDDDLFEQQHDEPLSLAPAFDRPLSSTSTASHVDT